MVVDKLLKEKTDAIVNYHRVSTSEWLITNFGDHIAAKVEEEYAKIPRSFLENPRLKKVGQMRVLKAVVQAS